MAPFWQYSVLPGHLLLHESVFAKRSKKFLSNKSFPAERRDFLVQKYYHKQILSSRRNVLPQKEISYHSKKCLATERNYHNKKFLATFLCNIKKFLVTGRNFLSQEEEIYFTVKKIFTRRNCLAKTFLFNWKSIKSIYPMG